MMPANFQKGPETPVLLSGELQGDPHWDRTVVLLGALGTSRAIWNSLSEYLHAAQIRTLAVDLRGQGDSPAGGGRYSIEALASDVIHTLDTHGLEQVDLVGISLGGAVAQEVALSWPVRLSTLTLLSTLSRFGDHESWMQRAKQVREHGTVELAAGIRGRWVSEEFAAAEPGVLDTLQQMVTHSSREGYAGSAEALAQWDTRGRTGDIVVPTLTVSGLFDRSATPTAMGVLTDQISGAQHYTVAAAHLTPVEQPKQVAELILRHLSAHPSAKGPAQN